MITQDRLRVLCWNLEWVAPPSARSDRLKSALNDHPSDVRCFTETTRDFGTASLHTIESSPDYGYVGKTGKRRKVILASRHTWSEVDDLGDDSMPPGRFVSGISVGIRWIGVCIPWHEAHVRTGRKDATRWSEHLRYLEGLSGVIRRYKAQHQPICVLGDFNQRIPRFRQPTRVFDALMSALGDGVSITTEGATDRDERHVIDHIVVDAILTARVASVIERSTPSGERLSDHSGVIVEIDAPPLTDTPPKRPQ